MAVTVTTPAGGVVTTITYAKGALIDTDHLGQLFINSQPDIPISIWASGQWAHADVT